MGFSERRKVINDSTPCAVCKVKKGNPCLNGRDDDFIHGSRLDDFRGAPYEARLFVHLNTVIDADPKHRKMLMTSDCFLTQEELEQLGIMYEK